MSTRLDLGYAALARNRVRPLSHILRQTEDGWVQLCTGQKAVRSHAGYARNATCAPCRTAHSREETAA